MLRTGAIAIASLLAGEAFSIPARLTPWTGGPAPELGLPDLAGRVHRLTDYRGKVLVVNFWATWCEPCRDEMPSLQGLKDRFAGDRMAVVAVNYGEGEARIESFIKQYPIAFPVLADRDLRVAKTWRVRVLPTTFILDPTGKIRYATIGERDWNTPEIESLCRSLLS